MPNKPCLQKKGTQTIVGQYFLAKVTIITFLPKVSCVMLIIVQKGHFTTHRLNFDRNVFQQPTTTYRVKNSIIFFFYFSNKINYGINLSGCDLLTTLFVLLPTWNDLDITTSCYTSSSHTTFHHTTSRHTCRLPYSQSWKQLSRILLDRLDDTMLLYNKNVTRFLWWNINMTRVCYGKMSSQQDVILTRCHFDMVSSS